MDPEADAADAAEPTPAARAGRGGARAKAARPEARSTRRRAEARRSPRRDAKTRWVLAVFAGAERDGPGVRIHYVAERGVRREIDEHLLFGPRNTLAAVAAVGRVLRILRAARLRPPADPYSLAEDPERAAELLCRCRGARLRLELRRRLERHLTVWTDSGVERIARVVDFHENPDGLAIRTLGSHTPRFVPRRGLIRYAARSEEYMQVLGVESP